MCVSKVHVITWINLFLKVEKKTRLALTYILYFEINGEQCGVRKLLSTSEDVGLNFSFIIAFGLVLVTAGKKNKPLNVS